MCRTENFVTGLSDASGYLISPEDLFFPLGSVCEDSSLLSLSRPPESFAMARLYGCLPAGPPRNVICLRVQVRKGRRISQHAIESGKALLCFLSSPER